MMISEAVSIVSLGLVATGSIATWLTVRRNSKKDREAEVEKARQTEASRQRLEDRLEYVKRAISDPETGLPAINNKVQQQLLHCHEVHGALNEKLCNIEKRVDQHEREIEGLRRGR